MKRGLLGALAGAALLMPDPGAALAQAPPRVNETHATLNWIIGRWRMPVTCEREDGSMIQLEESVVVRPAREDAEGRTVRVTFFGIDVEGARRCFNLTHKDVPDRRGVFYMTFVSHGRSDIGLTRLRQNLEEGSLHYEITRGKINVRHIGANSEEDRVVDFADVDAGLEVSFLDRGTDGYRLLTTLVKRDGLEGQPLRRLRFEVSGVEPGTYVGDYLEVPRRRR